MFIGWVTKPLNRLIKPVGRSGCDSGFTMIEVLVAVIVLSVGLLGLAGLQATGLRNNHSATLRSIASLQAYDIADRMRANQGPLAAADLAAWNADNASLLPSGSGTVALSAAGPPLIYTVTLLWTDQSLPATQNTVTFRTSFAL